MDPTLFSSFFSLIGAGVGFMGQQEAAKAASRAANASAAQSAIQYKEAMAKYTLASMVSHRQTLQQFRTGQQAMAAAKAAEVNQGGGGQALSQGSATGGALGSISGQVSSNVQGIQQQFGTYQQLFKDQSDIFVQQLIQAQAQSDEASAKGTMALGQDIAGLGGSLGKILPSFGSMFSPNGGLFGQVTDTGTASGASSMAFGI